MMVKATPDGKNAKATPFITGFMDKAKTPSGADRRRLLMPDGSLLVSDENMAPSTA